MKISGRVRFHESVEPLLCSMASVTSHPANPRNGDVDAIAESIDVNGFIAPVIAQKSTGHIIAGNHRYYALMQMGSDLIPVIWLDVTDAEAERYLLADNRTSDLGRYDVPVLVGLLNNLATEEQGLAGTGYTAYDLEVLQTLADMPNDSLDFAQWPTITMQVPPHVKSGFLRMTREAESDAERFELILRLAGWDGKK